MKPFRLASVFLALFVLMTQTSGAAQSASEMRLLAEISRQPADVVNYLELAKLYRADKRFDEAEQLLLRAIDLLREERRTGQPFGATAPVWRPSPLGRGQVPPPDPTQAPLRVGGDIKEPKKIKDVKPVYPAEAQSAGVQGVVILEAIIDRDGYVRQAKVLRSVPLLDQAAVDAVHQWQFTPTLLNNMPVEVIMTVTVSFTLR